MTIKTYEIQTEICEKCGEMRIRYPWIERPDIMPGMSEKSGTDELCACEREDFKQRMADLFEEIQKTCSPEVREIFKKVQASKQ